MQRHGLYQSMLNTLRFKDKQPPLTKFPLQYCTPQKPQSFSFPTTSKKVGIAEVHAYPIATLPTGIENRTTQLEYCAIGAEQRTTERKQGGNFHNNNKSRKLERETA